MGTGSAGRRRHYGRYAPRQQKGYTTRRPALTSKLAVSMVDTEHVKGVRDNVELFRTA